MTQTIHTDINDLLTHKTSFISFNQITLLLTGHSFFGVHGYNFILANETDCFTQTISEIMNSSLGYRNCLDSPFIRKIPKRIIPKHTKRISIHYLSFISNEMPSSIQYQTLLNNNVPLNEIVKLSDALNHFVFVVGTTLADRRYPNDLAVPLFMLATNNDYHPLTEEQFNYHVNTLYNLLTQIKHSLSTIHGNLSIESLTNLFQSIKDLEIKDRIQIIQNIKLIPMTD